MLISLRKGVLSKFEADLTEFSPHLWGYCGLTGVDQNLDYVQYNIVVYYFGDRVNIFRYILKRSQASKELLTESKNEVFTINLIFILRRSILLVRSS